MRSAPECESQLVLAVLVVLQTVAVVAEPTEPTAPDLTVVLAVAVGVAVAPSTGVVAARTANRAARAAQARSGHRSSWISSGHSGTLPCLRLGSSSRLVASIRSPATSFWRVSAGSITSSM